MEKVGDPTSYKNVVNYAEMYCNSLGLTEEQKKLFLRGEKVVVTDTSALLKNVQLIDELSKEYSRVVVPLSHSIQNNDFEMFQFLLHDCNANPNIGSRNPYDAGKIRQKNDGNMPLMIAAWDNKIQYVKELCADERTSLNQQDGNGFTALIKACYWGWLECRDIIIEAGADIKIVDRDGYTAEERYHEFLETGRRKNANFKKKQNWGGQQRRT